MKVCLLGCGVAVRHQMPIIRKFPDVSVIGICDTNEMRLREFGEAFGIRNRYADYQKMLADLSPDVVHIMTPPKTHGPLAIAAMEKGCHVLVEKPMAMSVTEADAMISTSEKSRVKLCIMHNHLFDPQVLRAKQMMSQGLLGDVLSVEVRYCLERSKMAEEGLSRPEHWSHRLPLGIFSEYLPHLIYLLLSFMDDVKSVKVSRSRDGVYSLAVVNGIGIQVFGEKSLGYVTMLDNMEYVHFSVHVYGFRRAVHMNMLDLTMTVERQARIPRRAAWMLNTLDQAGQNIAGIIGNATRILTGKLKRRPGHRALIKAFYESIRDNSAPPVTGEEGRKVVRLLQKVEEMQD
jgi:predicted dehydrogenase